MMTLTSGRIVDARTEFRSGHRSVIVKLSHARQYTCVTELIKPVAAHKLQSELLLQRRMCT
jgi:hypothetical protein